MRVIAPIPNNDHVLPPDPEVDQLYLDYGALFQAMKAQFWVKENWEQEKTKHCAVSCYSHT